MKSIVRLSLVALVSASLAACGGIGTGSGGGGLEKARADFASQSYPSARTRLFAMLEKEPDNVQVLALLGRTQIALGDADAADRVLARLKKAGGKGAELRRLEAGVSLLRGKPAAALALIVNDFDTDAWRLRAQAQLALGKQTDALASFEKGMAAGDDLPLSVAYARFALETGDLARAGQILTRMNRFAPGAYNTLVLAGDIAAARGETDGAIAAYGKATSAYPGKVPPMLALANALDEKGEVDAAMRVVEKAAKLSSGDPALEEMRIQLLAEKGEWKTIRLALQGREGRIDPASSLGLTYGEALLRLGHAEQARVLFSRASLLLPGNPFARMMLGEAQLASGDARGAWETLRPLASGTLAQPEILVSAERAARAAGAPEADVLKARLDPVRLKATMALADKGQAALSAQDWKLARATYRELLQRGDDPEVLKRMALAAAGLGQGSDALAYADRARRLAPDNPDYLHVAGLVRLELGRDLSDARRLLEAAAIADPRDLDIARDLGKAKAAAS
jgi:predicted Zn-dependent protease